VNVTDTDGDDVNCSLYINTTGSWVLEGYMTVTGGQGMCYVEVSDFTCGDMGTDNYFIFDLNDQYVTV